MKRYLIFHMIAVSAISTFFFSCKKVNPDPDPDTYYGSQVSMGNGTARSFFTVAKDGTPLNIGVEITDNALDNLPTDPEEFDASTFLLQVDQHAKDLTPYDHITINWNINGHEPTGIYDLPHFDVHFYQITVAEQNAIPPYQVDPSGFDNLPQPAFIPTGYFRSPGGVPQMGTHWGDVTAPQFNGQPFTYTMTYGSYNGNVAFLEPMVTLEYLKSGTTFEKEIRQPLQFSPTNKWYPTTYSVYKNASTGNHYIEMKNFVKK